jgi:3-hydroxyisobutyrate dehydrogenase-like beta-hydroxyacid dehydrogenase
MQHVTILGLGIMGAGMAHNLLKAGFQVRYTTARVTKQPSWSKQERGLPARPERQPNMQTL